MQLKLKHIQGAASLYKKTQLNFFKYKQYLNIPILQLDWESTTCVDFPQVCTDSEA
jgi:hypothetical protein